MNSKDLAKATPDWFKKFGESSQSERDSILDLYKKKFNYNFKNLELIGFTSILPYIDNGGVCVLKSEGPGLVFYIKNSPALLIMGDFKKSNECYTFKKEVTDQIRVSNGWVSVHAASSKSFETEVVELLLSGINQNKGLGPEICKALKKLSDHKVTPFLSYIRGSSKGEEGKSMFVHPFGKPTILSQCDKYVYIVSNPSLRFNGSVLSEVRENGYREEVVGATG